MVRRGATGRLRAAGVQSFTLDRLRQSSEFGLGEPPSIRPPSPRVLLAAAPDPAMSMLGMNSRSALGPVGNSGLVSGSSVRFGEVVVLVAAVAVTNLAAVCGLVIVTSSDRLDTTSWCVLNAFTSCATVNLRVLQQSCYL